IIYPDYNNRRLKNISILSKNVNSYFFPALQMYPFDPFSEDSRPAIAKIDTMGVVHDFFMYDTVPPLYFIGLPYPTRDNKIIVAGAKFTNNPEITDVFGSRLTTETLKLDSINWSTYTYDSLCPEIQSHTIPLDNCLVVVNTSDFQPPVRHFELHMSPIPTPANKGLKIIYDNTLLFRNITIRVFNILGNEVTSFRVNSGINESSINTENWNAGMYVAVAYSGSEKIGHCKIIIKK
ncbi:MAG: T9SS type A sorting domain-containing protein, partial [Chloroflexota bacterium]